MKQNQLYPFERNRYYSGKMLTSADFQAEQDYFNNKERFLNTMLFGEGIVCGLGVENLDDLSIMLESGVAIDSFGHEIVVEKSLVRKLSAIDGYKDLSSTDVSLCLQYQEKQVHSVYAVERDNAAKSHEYSRVSEGNRLFLMDSSKKSTGGSIRSDFLSGNIIFQDDNFKVELIIPETVSRGKVVKVLIRTTKLSEENHKMIFHATLQIPGFSYAGSSEVEIDLEDIVLNKEEYIDIPYWITAHKETSADTTLLIKSGSAYAYIDDEAVKVTSNFSAKVYFTNESPRDIVSAAINAVNLESRERVEKKDYVELAQLKLIWTANNCMIDQIITQGVRKYVYTPSTEKLRQEYLDYFLPMSGEKNTTSRLRDGNLVAQYRERDYGLQPEIATGTLEIMLEPTTKKGDIAYSGEILHGLGKGNVYVQVGYEIVSTDESLGKNAKTTIYGDASMFSQEYLKIPDVETAVKVLNDKGSFVVAAKLNNAIDSLILSYRWVAIKFPVGDEIKTVEEYEGKNIIPDTPTVLLNTRESHFFGVHFQNMDVCSISYELTEENSGEITSDGIYTAPSKEGVYEICIYCTEMPSICAYAYAIVKRENKAEIKPSEVLNLNA